LVYLFIPGAAQATDSQTRTAAPRHISTSNAKHTIGSLRTYFHCLKQSTFQ
jgi:hypothetical protein